MDQRLLDWWQGNAKNVFEDCIQHCKERIVNLLAFSENLAHSVKADKQSISDFSKDIKVIKSDIEKSGETSLLKNHETVFVKTLKHFNFEFALKTGALENMVTQSDNLVDDYAALCNEFEEIYSRFENMDNTLDISIIPYSTDLISQIEQLDKLSADVASSAMIVEHARDQQLEQLEDYINDHANSKLKINLFSGVERFMD